MAKLFAVQRSKFHLLPYNLGGILSVRKILLSCIVSLCFQKFMFSYASVSMKRRVLTSQLCHLLNDLVRDAYNFQAFMLYFQISESCFWLDINAI